MVKIVYNEFIAAIYRTVRVFIATGVAQAVLIRPNWSNPEETMRVISVAFVSGFIAAVFKYLRDKKVISAKLPI